MEQDTGHMKKTVRPNLITRASWEWGGDGTALHTSECQLEIFLNSVKLLTKTGEGSSARKEPNLGRESNTLTQIKLLLICKKLIYSVPTHCAYL